VDFLEKEGHFWLLHMKRKEQVLENEKYFDFSKWTKINVQKSIVEKVLTEKKIRFYV
jgi:hypothetical protein